MRTTAVILTGLLLTSAAPVALAQPVLTFGTEGVTAKGITPGGSAVWFGAGHARGEWFDHVYHFQQVANDDDGDGKVVFSQEKGLPAQSVLIAVDVASGEFVSGTSPNLAHPGARPLAAGATKYGPTGELLQLTEVASRLDVLLVRKGEGAWATSIVDGGQLDADKSQDGIVSLALASLPPIGATARAVGGAQPGDVLVVMDAGTLNYSVLRLTAQPK
jgi:hypothetical protein